MIHKSRLLLRIYDIEEQAQKKDTRHDENKKKEEKDCKLSVHAGFSHPQIAIILLLLL